jgi:hypothetical protein
MKTRSDRFHLAAAAAASLLMAACGGDPDPVLPPATTTNVSTTVIDGLIEKALVCVDKNSNGKCDTDETQGKTDAAGNVTLAVPNADVGKYTLVAEVNNTESVDKDHGPVTVAYRMAAPADQTGVVSPLTTLVQQTMATTGATSAEAAKAVQDQTGITASLFQDFTKVAAPTDGSISAAAVARLVVVTAQQQSAAVASTVGTPAVGGALITQADLDKAIQQKLLELLPDLVTALSSPAVLAATTPAAKEAALLAAATTLVADAGLTPAAVATVVAVNTQPAAPAVPPSAALNLDSLNFTNASNYAFRTLGGSLAQQTPDASNNFKYVERRTRAINGNVATWGSGGDPTRNSDLHWDGTAWAACPINFENTSSVRDAQGRSSYGYCGTRETGRTNRAAIDVSGKTYLEVYNQIRGGGYTNLSIGSEGLAALGTATFPTGSSVLYQTNTPLTNAIAYLPVGANSPAGTSQAVARYSAAVAAGGNISTQPAGTGCNTLAVGANGAPLTTLERDTNGTNISTLEGMIAASRGTPCVFAPSMSFTYLGVLYTSTDANEGWGITTMDLGTLGSAPVNFGTAPGFYTGNTRLRVAFTGGNAVTYYSCKQRFIDGGTRACTPIGSGGTYTITSLGDARALSFNNLPAETGPLTYKRVYVERAGLVHFGYQSKPTVTSKARLNTVAATALLGQLGLTPHDPSVPMALTAGSYAGTWDFRTSTEAVSATIGTTVFINGNGTVSCFDKELNQAFACSLNITDPATGAFSLTNGTNTASGTLDFQAGTGAGTYVNPTQTPSTGSFIGGRR